MSFTTAALLLAWIAIALLGLGFAALLQQLRSVQATLRLPAAARAGVPDAATRLAPTSGERRYVLTVDPGCAYCHEVVPQFRALAARYSTVAQFAILAESGDYPPSRDVDVLVDSATYHELAPSWSPGLLVMGPGGKLIDVAPGGDLTALERLLTRTAVAPSQQTSSRSQKTTEVTS